MNLHETPFIVIWETTRACALACVHCRAEAQPLPLPGELTHAEAHHLIDEIAELGTRILVFSGGDPLQRADLPALIRYGKARGLRVATIPAATPRLTFEALAALRDAGVDQVAFSLDASTAAAHDAFRRVEGAYAKTMEAVAWAHELGLPLQINTVMSASNFDDVDALIALMPRLGIVFWEVFFLVPTGRGSQLRGLTARQYDTIFGKLYDASQTSTYVLKITEAPHYRRYVIQRRQHAGDTSFLVKSFSEKDVSPGQKGCVPENVPAAGSHGHVGPQVIGLAPQAINAGKGHCFISCVGEVYPSGFLPLAAGNVRDATLRALYQESPVFRALRDPEGFTGRCGRCEYRDMCGGSRARAYAVTGDYLADDPCCAYQPTGRGERPHRG